MVVFAAELAVEPPLFGVRPVDLRVTLDLIGQPMTCLAAKNSVHRVRNPIFPGWKFAPWVTLGHTGGFFREGFRNGAARDDDAMWNNPRLRLWRASLGISRMTLMRARDGVNGEAT